MQELFGGLSRDELWPKLDLNAPGQLSEAQQAMRRSAINIPAFQFNGEFDPDHDTETSPAILTSDMVPEDMGPAPEPSPETEGKPKPRLVPPLAALILVALGAAAGSLITWFLVSR